LQTNKKDWFSQDATNLLTLISAKKKSEQKYHHDPTNPASIASILSARTKVKQAIKDAKEKWIRKTINKLEKIDLDPFTAWQSSKLLLAGLSHHHVNTKDKYIQLKDKYIQLKDKNDKLTAKPADQVQIQKQIQPKSIIRTRCNQQATTHPSQHCNSCPHHHGQIENSVKESEKQESSGNERYHHRTIQTAQR
jgi:hypothetical protein